MAPRIEHSRWLVLAAVAALVVSACSSGTSSQPPAATVPAATVPAATVPAATVPAATEPTATEPTATEPTATEPTATETAPAETLTPVGTPVTGLDCAASATEVKFWSSHTPPDSDSIANIVNQFNKDNPDICVKLTLVIGSETDVAQLVAAMHGGAAPDI
jgi:ABC-type glycerol-3-phosphate transport system substrate-binding protein